MPEIRFVARDDTISPCRRGGAVEHRILEVRDLAAQRGGDHRLVHRRDRANRREIPGSLNSLFFAEVSAHEVEDRRDRRGA